MLRTGRLFSTATPNDRSKKYIFFVYISDKSNDLFPKLLMFSEHCSHNSICKKVKKIINFIATLQSESIYNWLLNRDLTFS